MPATKVGKSLVELLLDSRLGHVRCQVDLVWKRENFGSESSLNLGENIPIIDFSSRVHGGGNETGK